MNSFITTDEAALRTQTTARLVMNMCKKGFFDYYVNGTIYMVNAKQIEEKKELLARLYAIEKETNAVELQINALLPTAKALEEQRNDAFHAFNPTAANECMYKIAVYLHILKKYSSEFMQKEIDVVSNLVHVDSRDIFGVAEEYNLSAEQAMDTFRKVHQKLITLYTNNIEQY